MSLILSHSQIVWRTLDVLGMSGGAAVGRSREHLAKERRAQIYGEVGRANVLGGEDHAAIMSKPPQTGLRDRYTVVDQIEPVS